MRILEDLWASDCRRGKAVPAHGDRAQEPEIISVFRHIRGHRKTYFSGHLHQRATDYFEQKFLVNQIQLGGGVIVQSRNLKDTIVSLKDHIERDYSLKGKVRTPWFVSLGRIWPSLTEDEKYHAVSFFYAFWHIDFQNSWRDYERGIFINYDEVTQSTPNVAKSSLA
jgi:hypothetical protein